jgi:hypothetical protein
MKTNLLDEVIDQIEMEQEENVYLLDIAKDVVKRLTTIRSGKGAYPFDATKWKLIAVDTDMAGQDSSIFMEFMDASDNHEDNIRIGIVIDIDKESK